VAVFGLNFDNSSERPVLWWRIDIVMKVGMGCNQGRGRVVQHNPRSGKMGIKIHISNKNLFYALNKF